MTEASTVIKIIGSCHLCSQKIAENGGMKGPDEKLYCSQCHSDLFTTCDYCGEIIYKDDSHWIGQTEEIVCDDCLQSQYEKCTSCGEFLPLGDVLLSPSDEPYCEACYNRTFTICVECGENIERDEAFSTSSGDLCEACFDEREQRMHDDDAPIKHYDYKPPPQWNGKGKLYMGVELEVAARNRGSATRMSDAEEISNDFFYCKEDGSVGYGYEIVSHPFTWQYYQTVAKEEYDELLENLREKGYRSYDTSCCGIHIHLSASAFTTLHLYKLMRFFYEPSQHYFIATISQREGDKLQEWATLDTREGHVHLASDAKAKRSPHRYVAVNLTERTVEIRIFRGTLCSDSFHKNIQFCHAAYWFTKESSIREINVKSFIKWLGNKKKYAELRNFIAKKGLDKCA